MNVRESVFMCENSDEEWERELEIGEEWEKLETEI